MEKNGVPGAHLFELLDPKTCHLLIRLTRRTGRSKSNSNKNGARQNAERGGSAGRHANGQFVNHVTDPHFVTFSSSLYITIRKPNPIPNPNRNPIMITDPQIGPSDPQLVTADPPRSSFCSVPISTRRGISKCLNHCIVGVVLDHIKVSPHSVRILNTQQA